LVPERLRSAAAALGLFALNAFLTLRLFHVAYTREMGSIEAAFISLARYIRDHFPHLTWFPLWYGGIPFADAYPPLLHLMVAGVAAATGADPGLAYHVVTATLYALGPAAFFWTAMRLGATRTGAFAGALGYSLLAPSCWLVHEVRADSGGWFGPRRLVSMVRYGEGPHIASLLFLVLAIGLLDLALERRRARDFVLAGLAMAATVLCNWIGAVELGIAAAAYLLAGVHKQWKRAYAVTAAVAIYGYAVAMPFVTPSTVATIRASAPRLVGFHSAGWRFLVGAACLPLLAWALKRLRVAPPLRFAALLAFAPAVLALASFWAHVDLAPQANRYHLEMDLGIWMLAAFVLSRLRPLTLSAPVRVSLVTAGIVVLATLVVHERRIARSIETPIDIHSTAEYRISHWLGRNMPGRRVFAPGSVSFWMDAFSDTPMLVGGFDNGITNQTLWDVNFQMLFGEKLPVALAWLKAYGCDAIVGDDFTSAEFFHPYSHPDRLHSLPELWRDGPEVVYAVPRRGSLAHAIYGADVVQQTPAPYETKAIDRYVAALDDPSLPQPSFQWRDPSHASISGNFTPDHLLSVQVTWDKGWNATVNGQRCRMWGDKLGQIVLEPHCDGPCTVELAYDGGFELRFARWASVLALLFGGAWIVWQKRSDSMKTN
jgi:hypothetical protein